MTRITLVGVDLVTLKRLIGTETIPVDRLTIEPRRNGVAFKANEFMWTSTLGTVEASTEPVAPQRFLSAKQVAERLGLKPGTLSRYALPEPDVTIGNVKGWTVPTIEAWNLTRRPRAKRGSES